MRTITLTETQLAEIMRLTYTEGWSASLMQVSDNKVTQEDLRSKGLKACGEESFKDSLASTMFPKLMDKANS